MRTGVSLRTVLLTVVSALLLSGTPMASEPEAGRVHTVKIKQMAFSPARLEVRVGDTVEWVNEDFVPHDVTANAPSDGEPAFASEVLQAGAKFRHQVTEPGSFAYRCTLHPTMKGSLLVK